MLKKESKILALFITFVLIFNIILPVISNAANDTTIGLVNAEGEGEPIFVKPDADDEEIERIRKQVEDTLNTQYEILKKDFKKFEKLKQ